MSAPWSALGIAAACVAVALGGMTLTPPEPPEPVVAPAAVEHVGLVAHPLHGIRPTVTFAAVGDSITTLEYLGQPRGVLSWVNWVNPKTATYVGGWAQSGKQTWEMAAAVTPYAADVLVVMAGTNDVNNGGSPQTAMAYLDLIVERAQVAHVVVCAIAPTYRHPVEAAAFNAVLAEHVAAQGWTFVDPWTNREPDGTPTPGTTYDKLHPNGAQQSITGAILTDAIWSAVHPDGKTFGTDPMKYLGAL